VYAQVLLGYEKGAPLPGNGAMRPRFGQVHSERLRNIEVLQLWPLEFPMNTRASTTTRPLATLWRPTLVEVRAFEIAFAGLERVEIAGSRRWTIQRWLCDPMTYADAVRKQAESKAETWRWA
jgi:hypothetical protein